MFDCKSSGSSITSKCSYKIAERFNRSIKVVDTPGLFNTTLSNNEVQREISKCIQCSSPGPHCIFLVVSIGRFTQEEKETIDHFANYFGKNLFHHCVVVFTRKDDLMHDGSSIEEYIKTAPESLKQLINNCNGRYLAFDNRARGTERDKQVKNLLAMIDEILIANDGNWYTISMYEEAERVMNLREEEIKKQREKELDMRDEVIKKLQEEVNNRPSLRDEARPSVQKCYATCACIVGFSNSHSFNMFRKTETRKSLTQLSKTCCMPVVSLAATLDA